MSLGELVGISGILMVPAIIAIAITERVSKKQVIPRWAYCLMAAWSILWVPIMCTIEDPQGAIEYWNSIQQPPEPPRHDLEGPDQD